jgi:autophagy-related protein 18
MTCDSDNCFLAYPGSNTTGEVQLFDAFNLQAKLMIPAHDSPLGMSRILNITDKLGSERL